MPEITRSTALGQWTTAEWEDYMDFLRRWAVEQFGIVIEEPNQVDEAIEREAKQIIPCRKVVGPLFFVL